jgi:hypothetical protein
LYEAVAQALGILRGDTWVEEIGEGLTELTVRVKQPVVEHRVRMKDFRRWLESPGQDARRVHQEKEAAGVSERRMAEGVIGSGGLHALPFRKTTRCASAVPRIPPRPAHALNMKTDSMC